MQRDTYFRLERRSGCDRDHVGKCQHVASPSGLEAVDTCIKEGLLGGCASLWEYWDLFRVKETAVEQSKQQAEVSA